MICKIVYDLIVPLLGLAANNRFLMGFDCATQITSGATASSGP